MRGYRTLIFAAIMAVAGVFGHHLAPDIVNSYLDAIFAVAAVGVAIMRLLTSTPVGLAAHPALADLANLLTAATAKEAAPATADPDVAAGPTADAPASGGATVTGPPDGLEQARRRYPVVAAALDSLSGSVAPAPDIVAMANSVVTALATIQKVHSDLAGQLQTASATVAAALPAPAAVPVPQPAVAAAGQQ